MNEKLGVVIVLLGTLIFAFGLVHSAPVAVWGLIMMCMGLYEMWNDGRKF